MYNVLVYPAGTEIGLEIFSSLQYSSHIKLFGASSVRDFSFCCYDNIRIDAPYVDDDSLIDYLNNLVEQYNIDYIFPAHDTAVLKLAEAQGVLRAKVIGSPVETCRICRDKSKTYMTLSGQDFVPLVYPEFDSVNFPAFLKPKVGQGSVGAVKISSLDDLHKFKDSFNEHVVCEYLQGEEYTVDCFTGADRELLFVNPRSRDRTKSGISVSSSIVECDPEFLDIAMAINSSISFSGGWFFQVKRDGAGRLKLLEVAPRVAGTMGLTRAKGVNIPLMSLFLHAGKTVTVCDQNIPVSVERALHTKAIYKFTYSKLYIDLDDTIIVSDKVNLDAIKLIYGAKNAGKRIILITRHDKNVIDTLNTFCINKSVFDEIVHIQNGEPKSSFIDRNDSIFVDDSFSERIEVHNALSIPVFDLDAITHLI